ncbi:MAG: hypothetical protein KAR44_00875 [Candidatus Aegiribacteria sp.]|nr:hypothetical protein [Candidatus Aegiribacteria sp.]
MKKEAAMKIEWECGWLTWVSSVTMCLNALGIECDKAEVAGYSGYAFALAVNEGLCASGPTFLDWNKLASRVCTLGRSTLTFFSMDCYSNENRNENTKSHARTVFDLASDEIDAGRPCVVWGLGLPEFGVVRGIEGEEYVCVQGGATPERVRWDEIDAPGGPYILAFPTKRSGNTDWNMERESVRSAVMMMNRLNYAPNMQCGLSAYDFWCTQLAEEKAVMWTNSYNAQCWSEARQFAADFIGRLAKNNSEIEHLREAHDYFLAVAENMKGISEMFPFTLKFEKDLITDSETITRAIGFLESAKKNEIGAIESLKQALSEWD